MDVNEGMYFRVKIEGVVQGVGFRPFVYREAVKFGVRGYVRNVSGAVEIVASGKRFDEFVTSVQTNKPANSVIYNITVEPAGHYDADGFKIIKNGVRGSPGFAGVPPGDADRADDPDAADPQTKTLDYNYGAVRAISTDIAVCDTCAAEFRDANNRRAGHLFISCAACGPRYSILNALPYDRAATSMYMFPLCDSCAAEYASPGDIRFAAETICCPNCGPSLCYKRGDEIYNGNAALGEAVKDMADGIAVKGLGGYHLACSPHNGAAVRKMRVIKGRETKPFAVMFKDLSAVRQCCAVSDTEAALLKSPARPIVLLKLKTDPFAPEVLNGSGRCGCFLPYTPLHALMLDKTGALVMTSANISGSPIVTDDGEINELCDRVLSHERTIVRSVEDSVAQVSDKTYLIRRARGYAPAPVKISARGRLLAAGGDLKSAFGFLDGDMLTLSPYIGDLENYDVFEQYKKYIDDFLNLYGFKPEACACDAHPGYFSGAYIRELALNKNIPFITVYHHHAHVASVMAEHGLDKVIGVAMDGAGYGDDGRIWGGEFFICDGPEYRRAGHLEYIDILGSDDSAKDAGKTAACYVYKCGFGAAACYPRGVMAAALNNSVNTYSTSSMGRLFDAAASLSGVRHYNGYEGECASMLQYKAEAEARSRVTPLCMRFDIKMEDGVYVCGFTDIIGKCLAGAPGAALGFHTAVCEMITDMCLRLRDETGLNDAALSGGCFQNLFLLDMVRNNLAGSGFHVYTNVKTPPNDGGLAAGQAYIGAMLCASRRR